MYFDRENFIFFLKKHVNLFQIDPNKEIQLDVSSTSSDSETDYLTPLTGLRKEELLQKERELQTRSKRSKDKKKHEKKSKRKRKKRFVHIGALYFSFHMNEIYQLFGLF